MSSVLAHPQPRATSKMPAAEPRANLGEKLTIHQVLYATAIHNTGSGSGWDDAPDVAPVVAKRVTRSFAHPRCHMDEFRAVIAITSQIRRVLVRPPSARVGKARACLE